MLSIANLSAPVLAEAGSPALPERHLPGLLGAGKHQIQSMLIAQHALGLSALR
ncbi:MAG: hypothetical protein QM674_18755 [Burkholderiaceae bacterium]